MRSNELIRNQFKMPTICHLLFKTRPVVQKCDYLQDQEDNLRNLAHILACCVASEMTSGVRATLLFVGHQLRPIGLPVACTVVFCTVVFCTVVFCTASSACSTSANMPLGCKARHFTSMGKSIRSGNFKLPVVAIIVLPLPLHCTNGGAKAMGAYMCN